MKSFSGENSLNVTTVKLCSKKKFRRFRGNIDAFLISSYNLKEKCKFWWFVTFYYYLSAKKAGNSKFFWAKLLLLKCFESANKWLYPKNVSGSVQVLKKRIKVDKLDFFSKMHLKNSFCFGWLWISRRTGRQN